MKKLACLIAACTLVILGLGTAKAEAAEPLPNWVTSKAWESCVMEDDRSCIWDGKHQGNSIGDSVIITRKGKVIIITHKQAHQLLRPVYAV